MLLGCTLIRAARGVGCMSALGYACVRLACVLGSLCADLVLDLKLDLGVENLGILQLDFITFGILDPAPEL